MTYSARSSPAVVLKATLIKAKMRLESTKPTMAFLPSSVIGYAWLAQELIYVASLCTALFIGFFHNVRATLNFR